jgi:hypothetical protein
MQTQLPPAGELNDTDRRRACRVAHLFGAVTALALAALLAAPLAFRSHPLPLAALLVLGPAAVLTAGSVADLMVRPARVKLAGPLLTVTRFGRSQAVHVGRLASLSAVPNAAGVVRLSDDRGGRIRIDVRCLARNPLIWERVDAGIRDSARRGSLTLDLEEQLLWDDVTSEVERAQQRILAALDFQPH